MHERITPLDRPLPPGSSKTLRHRTPSRSQRAVHPAKKTHGQVTLLDRPLPRGEGRGEGFVNAHVTVDIGGACGHEATARPSPQHSSDSCAGGRGQRLRARFSCMWKRCANCRMVDSNDPSPRPSPGGRGRSSGVTCPCIFYVEWSARWPRLVRVSQGTAVSRRDVDRQPSLERLQHDGRYEPGHVAAEAEDLFHEP